MKKKFWQAIALTLALGCALVSCDGAQEPTVSVSDDGYVMVNGNKTEYTSWHTQGLCLALLESDHS